MHEWIVCDGCAVFQSPFMMKTMGKSDHEHPLLHMPFLVLYNASSVSVVFDFNASLNDAHPLSIVQLPNDLMKNGKVVFLSIPILCFFFVFTIQKEISECCV